MYILDIFNEDTVGVCSVKGLKCPACGGKLGMNYKPKLGSRFRCRWCGSMLEVVDLDPIEFDSFYDENEQIDNPSNQQKRFLV
jgi:lysine biosynthesis protein LysW